jgi:F0F1-type ATP synthase assembly protein I
MSEVPAPGEGKGNRKGTEGRESPEEEKLPSGLAGMFGSSLKQAAPYMEAAYTLVGAILGLGFIGWLLDRHFGTAPLWLAAGLLLGVFVGLYGLARVVLWRR